MTAIHRWLAEPMPRDVARAVDRIAAARGVEHVAVMPDVHLADGVCVGTVVGTDGWLYPQAVGGDVGCGMAAVRLVADGESIDTEPRARSVFAALRERVPTVRRAEPWPVDLSRLTDAKLHRGILRDARIEFGTLGRGNHFLEVQRDEQGALWLAVHSGSRALGPAVQAWHRTRATPVGNGLVALPAEGAGPEWLRDVEVAVDYARQNRRAIAEAAALALAAAIGAAIEWPTWFDTVHNFVRRERHGDRELWVHRKGACAAAAGEPAMIPGSMGTDSYHVSGRGHPDALASCSHGAGRRLPRGAAMRTIAPREFERSMRGVFFETALAGRLRDEAPAAYKDVGAVLRAQRDLVRIERRLTPVLAYKGV